MVMDSEFFLLSGLHPNSIGRNKVISENIEKNGVGADMRMKRLCPRYAKNMPKNDYLIMLKECRISQLFAITNALFTLFYKQ